MPPSARARLLLVATVATIVLTVFGISHAQREAAELAYQQGNAAERILSSMLNQETGLRGFALTRDESFLDPFTKGSVQFQKAVNDALAGAGADQRKAVNDQVRVARRWQALARTEVSVLRSRPERPLDKRLAVSRRRVFDEFRVQNERYQREVSQARDRDLGRAGLNSVAAVIALSLLFGGVGYIAIERGARQQRARDARERRYRETQGEFVETMQIMSDEGEAHALVKRHLEREIEGSSVLVLNRNNSDNRLVATTEVAAASPLAEPLIDAGPDSCLAVRLARPYAQSPENVPLLACKVCGKSAGEVACVPSLVGGEVIGSVLVQQPESFDARQRERITETVGQAAPVLANLRTLAMAETRAATDALTGLPNARTCEDNLRRMLAQAGRQVAPLSAVLFDLDHFKEVNDRFGHGAGDDVLAAVGETVGTVLRESDFAGRYGGEEFLLLLPDTDRDGAVEAAEKVRAAIAKIEMPQVERVITASFGVSTYPLDTIDGQQLMRMADRALYEAKAGGRNRVAVAKPGTEGPREVVAEADLTR